MNGVLVTDDIIIYNDMPRGWVGGKYQPRWHKKVYMMWFNMWKRVYTNIYYFGSLIYTEYKTLSKFVDWIESQPRFEEFCDTCDEVRWVIDKDIKDINRNYYPEYMTLTTQSENSKERNKRKGSPFLNKISLLKASIQNKKNLSKSILGIKNNKIVLLYSINDSKLLGFEPSSICNCLKHRQKTHRGYKWYYVSYKHNKSYRRILI